MNQHIIKGLLKVAGIAVEGLTSKSLVIAESTAQELTAVFLSNKNHPRAGIILTQVSPQEVTRRCQEFFTGRQAKQQNSLTKDGWVAIQADRGSDFNLKFGYEHRPHHYLILIRGQQGGGSKVVMGCRFISDKYDVFKALVKPSEERVAWVAQAVDPSAPLEALTPGNCIEKVGS